MVAIVEEDPSHGQQIAALLHAAFDGDAESDLVDRLRQDRLIVASLVALADRDVVGHVLFSDLAVTIDARVVKAAALAPLAVRHDHQRRGIGSRLVLAGLSIVRDRQYAAVIVVGHADYYPRFGFSAVLARKLIAPFTGGSFMALELMPGALQGEAGTVRYPPAFKLD